MTSERRDQRPVRLTLLLAALIGAAVLFAQVGSWWGYAVTFLLLPPVLVVSAMLVVLEAKDGLSLTRRFFGR